MHTDRDTTSRGPARPHGRPPRLRWLLGLVPAGVLLASGVGCRHTRDLGKPDRNYDLLTAELRTREQELLEARAELAHLRGGNPGARSLAGGVIPGPGCLPGETVGHPTSVGSSQTVRGIALGSGTGGVDDDQQPGDESFMVVLVPRDDDGSPVKAPGTLRVSAYDVTPEGLKVSIGRWEVPPDQLRQAWRSGLLSKGYFVPLQWDRHPTSSKVRVIARLTTLDGRDFEAEKDVTIRSSSPGPVVAPGPRGPVIGPASPVEPKIPPPTVPELPPPAGLKGTTTSQPVTPVVPGVEELHPPAATLGAVKAIP